MLQNCTGGLAEGNPGFHAVKSDGFTMPTRASVFSGSRIDGSRGFAISRLYDTYRQFLRIIINMPMCMCLSVLYL